MNVRELARVTRREGKALARKVRRGEITRAQVEACRRAFPNDAEPVIALDWLDRWGIR